MLGAIGGGAGAFAKVVRYGSMGLDLGAAGVHAAQGDFATAGMILGGHLGGAALGKLSKIKPKLGRKLDYFLGKATGRAHNIERSTGMLRQLERIGLPDSTFTRTYLKEVLTDVINNPSAISKSGFFTSKTTRETLIIGPRGILKFETMWRRGKLITGIIHG